MSLDEIKDLIRGKGLKPRLLPGAMMKELVWDDQWIGYDDEETVAMKKTFANNLGFGGIMAWSIDFNAAMSETPPLSTDGSCGPANRGTTCEGGAFGSCCSANGWCGSTERHCGSGCLSGQCIEGGVTADGSCGAQSFDGLTGKTFSLGCTLFTGTTTQGPLPTYTSWPEEELVWVEDDDDEVNPPGGHRKSHCRLVLLDLY